MPVTRTTRSGDFAAAPSFSETDRLVAVLRRPEGLAAIISRVCAPEAPPPWPEGPDPQRVWRRRFLTREVPFASVPKRLCPSRARILEAWTALGVARWDAATRFHVRVLALETVPAPDVRAVNVSAPGGDVRIVRPRATAAHPRAYRGTTVQPPKRRRAETTDLRPLVCHPNGLAEVLRLLEGDLEEDLLKLSRNGYDAERLAQAASRAGSADFAFAYHHGGPRPAGLALPPWFATEVLPLAHGLPWAGVRQLLALCRTLGLAEDRHARACVTRLLASTSPERALPWLSLAPSRPTPRQAPFVGIVADSRVVGEDPPPEMEGWLARLDACTTETIYAHRLGELLRGVAWARSRDIEYLLLGFELASKYAKTEDLDADELPADEEYPSAELRAVAAHIAPVAALRYPGLALTVWARCCALPGLAHLIRTTVWDRLPPPSAYALLEFLADLWQYDAPEKVWGPKWRFFRREFSRIVERVEATPPSRQEKLVRAFRAYRWYWDDAADLERCWPAACSIAVRLASTNFSEEELGADVLACFVSRLPPDLWARVFEAPDRCFLALEVEVDRGIFGNQRMLDGIGTLARHLPEVVVEGFLRHPRPLLKAVKVLGSLSEPEGRRVVESFDEHAMNDLKLLDRPLADVCALLARHAQPGANPVPKRLREHVERRGMLTPGQIERHRRVLAERLLRSRIDLLAELAVDAMGRGLLLDRRHAALRHALEMLRFSDRNRRGLRRLLQAIADGKSPAEHLLQHPATQVWLRRHPRVDAETWTRGVSLVVQVAGLGQVDLALEQDPLEALRLGTYVGTCLGLGQTCAYSAAAVVLDVNKQVVYARNARGRVLARQLVAISEDDRLVCFQVYPESVSNELKAAFLEFDLRFADTLGLPIHEDDGPGRPDIAFILAQEWWDDGVWDIFSR